MNSKFREFLEKLNKSCVIKYRKTTFIGLLLVAVGVVGIVPSVVLGMPYIAQKFENAKALTNTNDKEVNKEYKIATASESLILDVDNVFVANNIVVNKSKTGYSYLNIVNSADKLVECEIAFNEEDKTSTAKIQFDDKQIPGTELSVGMSVDEAIQVLANKAVTSTYPNYTVEVYLENPVDLILNEGGNGITIEDSSVIKSLTTQTTEIYNSSEQIETLNIKSRSSHVNLHEDILYSFKNINVEFDKNISMQENTDVSLNLNKHLDRLPEVININADSVTINSPYKLANKEININARKSLEFNNLSQDADRLQMIINAKAVRELVYYDSSFRNLNISGSSTPLVDNNGYSLDNDSNVISFGDGKDANIINITNDIDKISLH